MTQAVDEALKNRVSVIVVPTDKYNDIINEIAKKLGDNYMNIMYVTLNNLYQPLKRKLSEAGVKVENYFFIDCVTKGAMGKIPANEEQCIYVSSPSALTEISIAITKSLQTKDPDFIVFDSLSTLLIYSQSSVVNQFAHSIVTKINAFGSKIVFPCLKSEKEEELLKSLSLVADKITYEE